MSASAQGSTTTSKMGPADDKTANGNETTKPAATLEEDDEFEDFPVEDWPQEDTELPAGTTHLWEESWDDDDTNDQFAKQLREELKKMGGSGKA